MNKVVIIWTFSRAAVDGKSLRHIEKLQVKTMERLGRTILPDDDTTIRPYDNTRLEKSRKSLEAHRLETEGGHRLRLLSRPH